MRTDRLYSLVEAAGLLNVPVSTLRKKAARDQVPHRKVVRQTRFSASDLLAIQEVRGQQAAPGPNRTTGRRQPLAGR
jgi:hypothetical protein